LAAALRAVEETAQARVQAAAQEAAKREQVRFGGEGPRISSVQIPLALGWALRRYVACDKFGCGGSLWSNSFVCVFLFVTTWG
jgi:hypothetical protein